jgi:hypothetical protein
MTSFTLANIWILFFVFLYTRRTNGHGVQHLAEEGPAEQFAPRIVNPTNDRTRRSVVESQPVSKLMLFDIIRNTKLLLDVIAQSHNCSTKASAAILKAALKPGKRITPEFVLRSCQAKTAVKSKKRRDVDDEEVVPTQPEMRPILDEDELSDSYEAGKNESVFADLFSLGQSVSAFAESFRTSILSKSTSTTPESNEDDDDEITSTVASTEVPKIANLLPAVTEESSGEVKPRRKNLPVVPLGLFGEDEEDEDADYDEESDERSEGTISQYAGKLANSFKSVLFPGKEIGEAVMTTTTETTVVAGKDAFNDGKATT